jgi:hypothetical protein
MTNLFFGTHCQIKAATPRSFPSEFARFSLAFWLLILGHWQHNFGMKLFISPRSTLFTILICTTACLGAHLRADNPVIDLGYAQYQGYYNSTSRLNVFLG